MVSQFLNDVIEHCWVGQKPERPQFVKEVKMSDFGTVDFVIADVDDAGTAVREFVSVELQAIDITGSYEPAYTALLKGEMLRKRPTFGFNWANVRKRYITQLIHKGFFHHQWGTRVVSVLQDHVFENFQAYFRFRAISIAEADIVFMVYRYKETLESGEKQLHLELCNTIGVSHSDLMMQVLYRQTPPKQDFCKRIIDRLSS